MPIHFDNIALFAFLALIKLPFQNEVLVSFLISFLVCKYFMNKI